MARQPGSDVKLEGRSCQTDQWGGLPSRIALREIVEWVGGGGVRREWSEKTDHWGPSNARRAETPWKYRGGPMVICEEGV